MLNRFRREGLLFILSSPSGAGKTTLARKIFEAHEAHQESLTMSLSCTTRPRLEGEEEGADYRFLDEETFERMVKNGDFLEHARVFGHRYATPRAPVERALARGEDMLFDIDWQGAGQIYQNLGGEKVVRVFIVPPSRRVLRERLRSRRRDSEESVEQRLQRAGEEISHYKEYDYIVLNDDLERAFQAVQAILQAERHKRLRFRGLSQFVSQFSARQG